MQKGAGHEITLPSLDFAHTNIMHKKLKEREKNHAHPRPSRLWLGKNSIEKGHGWAQFRTRVSLSFKFSRIMFARAKSKGGERESLGMRLSPDYNAPVGLDRPHHRTLMYDSRDINRKEKWFC